MLISVLYASVVTDAERGKEGILIFGCTNSLHHSQSPSFTVCPSGRPKVEPHTVQVLGVVQVSFIILCPSGSLSSVYEASHAEQLNCVTPFAVQVGADITEGI